MRLACSLFILFCAFVCVCACVHVCFCVCECVCVRKHTHIRVYVCAFESVGLLPCWWTTQKRFELDLPYKLPSNEVIPTLYFMTVFLMVRYSNPFYFGSSYVIILKTLTYMSKLQLPLNSILNKGHRLAHLHLTLFHLTMRQVRCYLFLF